MPVAYMYIKFWIGVLVQVMEIVWVWSWFSDLQEECGEIHKELMNAKQNLERETQMKEQLQDEVAALNAQVTLLP